MNGCGVFSAIRIGLMWCVEDVLRYNCLFDRWSACVPPYPVPLVEACNALGAPQDWLVVCLISLR